MEHPHEDDPKRATSSDPWDEFSERLSAIKDHLTETYRTVASEDDGPSEDDLKSAFSTLGAVWNQVADSVGTALRDPDTREHLKEVAASFATALGATLSELGDEIKDGEPSEEE